MCIYTTPSDRKLTTTSCRAVNTYTFNGGNKENGIDFNDKNTLGRVLESDIRAPGMINIPVCTAMEAYLNWAKGRRFSDSKFYPCN